MWLQIPHHFPHDHPGQSEVQFERIRDKAYASDEAVDGPELTGALELAAVPNSPGRMGCIHPLWEAVADDEDGDRPGRSRAATIRVFDAPGYSGKSDPCVRAAQYLAASYGGKASLERAWLSHGALIDDNRGWIFKCHVDQYIDREGQGVAWCEYRRVNARYIRETLESGPKHRKPQRRQKGGRGRD